MSQNVLRNQLPQIIITVLALVAIVPFFIDIPVLNDFSVLVQRMVVPMVSLALAIGGLDLLLRNYKKFQNKAGGWKYTPVLFVTFIFFFFVTAIPNIEHSIYYIPTVGALNEAIWGMVSLFMASMAYRGFRAKNSTSLAFTISAIIVFIANAPIGEAIWPGAPAARDWIMSVINMSAMRALSIGIGLGILAYGLRVLSGNERRSFGEFGKKEGRD